MCDDCYGIPASQEMVDHAVSEGAQALDQKYPEGWAQRINIFNLDTGSSLNCVGAQLEGSWVNFVDAMNLEWEELARLGFDTYHIDELPMLNSAWWVQINKRVGS